jgi:hypothetical protein
MLEGIVVPSKEISWLTERAFASSRREVRVDVTTSVTFHNTFWDGGSKNEYRAVRLADGRSASLETGSSPWTAVSEGVTVDLVPGVAIVERSTFCGKVQPLRVHLHPENAARLLASAGVLDHQEPVPTRDYMVLRQWVELSSSGRKDEWERYPENRPSPEELDSLVARGLLARNKAGAMSVTTAGKNAMRGRK